MGAAGAGLFLGLTSAFNVFGDEAASRSAPELPPASVVPEPVPILRAETVLAREQHMAGLQLTLARLVDESGLGATVSYAVTDLATGETIDHRGRVLQRSGCVINLFALVRALRDVSEGRADFVDYEWLMGWVAGYSDAAAAFDIYALLGDGDVFTGMERVEAMAWQELGLYDVVLDHPPGYEWDTREIADGNYVSALAMNESLGYLARGELLPEPWGSYLLALLADVDPGLGYLLADLPPEALVSHKNGWFDFEDGRVENDIAIVQFERDGLPGAYAITYLSDRPSDYRAVLLAQAITHATWEFFSGQPLAPAEPVLVTEPVEEPSLGPEPSAATTEPAAEETPASADPDAEPDLTAAETPAPESTPEAESAIE